MRTKIVGLENAWRESRKPENAAPENVGLENAGPSREGGNAGPTNAGGKFTSCGVEFENAKIILSIVVLYYLSASELLKIAVLSSMMLLQYYSER